MECGNCSCQATCSVGCQKNCADGEEICICPNGFFLDQDSNCVPEQECSCYEEGFGVIPDGVTQVNSDCSRRCSCNNNKPSCVNIQCSSDATCKEIGGAHQCQCNVEFEGPTTVPPATMSDCLDLYNAGNTADGVYTISVGGSDIQVYCDMTTDGGGWTVLQRRWNGSENFYRNWATYKAGFGPLTGEHWLGNDKIHTITSSKGYQLRVDLVVSGGSSNYELYDNFLVNNEDDNYRMSSGLHSGTAGLLNAIIIMNTA
ncbi:Angiopoietin-4 [Holothuria leucospilota]|uniref:Angiopoietin-4 n=1 Tax=Holothuria leucospilota TaxID=206669 RepID=A0A9Q1BUU0_HOLLE|nr:Angiopoietin-4 [Holothuria leucospilota]